MVARLLIAAILGYRRLFSWYRAPACRFIPSCSQYAAEAIQRFGPLGGMRLAGLRLLRCRPGGPFGFDPVPEVGDAPSRHAPGQDAPGQHAPGQHAPGSHDRGARKLLGRRRDVGALTVPAPPVSTPALDTEVSH